MQKKYSFLTIFLLLILSLGTIIPLFSPGFFHFHDDTQTARVYEMANSLRDGMFPVRWVENLGYGYGYPIFNFYAPFAYYIGGFASVFGFDNLVSTKLMFGFGILSAGITMYFLSKKFFGEFAGVLSGIIYMYFPYHAVNIYVRGAVSEFFAYAFLPIFFLGVFCLLDLKKSSKLTSSFQVLMIGIGVFFVSISHNLTLLMLLIISIPLITGIVFLSSYRLKSLYFFLTGLILGLSMAAFYLIPAFLEQDFTNVTSVVGGGSDFRDHFVCLSQLWNGGWGFGGSIPGCIDGLSFKLGKSNLLILLISVLLLTFSILKNKLENQEKIAVFAFFLFLFSLFLTQNYSKFIWEAVPYISYLQFPWRFINFTGLFISLVSGYLIYFVTLKKPKYSLLLVSLLVAITIFYSYNLFFPQNIDSNIKSIKEDEIRFEISKISDEYMPKNFLKPMSLIETPIEGAILKGDGDMVTLEKTVDYQKYAFETPVETRAFINTAYFPSWKAFVNGGEVELFQEKNGMSIILPEGKNTLEVVFVGTIIQNVSNLISLITILLVILYLIYSKIYIHGRSK